MLARACLARAAPIVALYRVLSQLPAQGSAPHLIWQCKKSGKSRALLVERKDHGCTLRCSILRAAWQKSQVDLCKLGSEKRAS